MHRNMLIAVLLLALLTTTCIAQPPVQRTMRGTILVWHTWPAPADGLLQTFFDTFMEIHPDVTIVSEYVAEERLANRFLDHTEAGLGPDVLIGLSPQIVADLVEQGRLHDIARSMDNLPGLNAAAVDALETDGRQFGLPLAAHTQVLFYNKRQTTVIPTDLSDIIVLAQQDQIAAMPVDFYHSYWGLHGFAGAVNLEAGRTPIAAGLEDWLAWLQAAQKEPKLILGDDPEELFEIFAGGQATFLIGSSALLPALRERLAADAVGVAYLPANHAAAADEAEDGDDLQELYHTPVPPGGFLELEVAAVSEVSAKQELAMALLAFLTNAVQQRHIASSDLGYAPVNDRVRFDHRLAPSERTLVRQSANAILIPLRHTAAFSELQAVADEGYAQVLGGMLDASAGAEFIRHELHLIAHDDRPDGS